MFDKVHFCRFFRNLQQILYTFGTISFGTIFEGVNFSKRTFANTQNYLLELELDSCSKACYETPDLSYDYNNNRRER